MLYLFQRLLRLPEGLDFALPPVIVLDFDREVGDKPRVFSNLLDCDASRGIHGDHLPDEVAHVVRKAETRGNGVLPSPDHVIHRGAIEPLWVVEGVLPCQHDVQHYTGGPNVGDLRVVLMTPFQQLGRHIRRNERVRVLVVIVDLPLWLQEVFDLEDWDPALAVIY